MRAGDATGRRPRRAPAVIVLAAALLAASTMGACGDDDDAGGAPSRPTTEPAAFPAGGREPDAGRWRPWVLPAPDTVRVPAPPAEGSAEAEADRAEMKRLAEDRTADVRDTVRKWNGPFPVQPWSELAFDYVSQTEKNPPLSSRNYALVHAAAYDAVVSAWYWKYRYRTGPPQGGDTLVAPGRDPSYPSEHAAIAGAASRVLAHLYPDRSALRLDEMAEEAARSRVQAGVNTPTDVAAGLELGRQVAEAVIAYAEGDGAGRPWDGTRPPGIGRGPAFWEPPPGSVSPPTEPMAGTWKPWVMTSGRQFRPGPPPAYGSPAFVAAARELVDMQKHLTRDQRRIAEFWGGAEGTPLPAGILLGLVMEDLRRAMAADRTFTLPRAVRGLALVSVALADAGVAAWDAKFTYWNPRPENAIRDLGVDPGFEPVVATPRFPAYPSGSAGYAGAAQTVMTYLLPNRAADFEKRAEEQAVSRLYAGIHWRYDAVSLEAGRRIGELVVARAREDGAG